MRSKTFVAGSKTERLRQPANSPQPIHPPPNSSFFMEFRRITNLPPYVFTIIDQLKIAGRRAGDDIIDLGFGNPDLPSPDITVAKLQEAAENPRNHRYSSSRGIPKLREAMANYYDYRWNVKLDPETQLISTIGAKEGLSHLMWVLTQPGDAVLVLSLIHI